MDYYAPTSEYSPVSEMVKDHTQAPVQPNLLMQALSPATVPSEPLTLAHPSAYDSNYFSLNWPELWKRAVKYLILGLAIAFVAGYLLKSKMTTRDVVILALTAALVFAILDTVSPSVSAGAQLGTAFGLGQALIAPALI